MTLITQCDITKITSKCWRCWYIFFLPPNHSFFQNISPGGKFQGFSEKREMCFGASHIHWLYFVFFRVHLQCRLEKFSKLLSRGSSCLWMEAVCSVIVKYINPQLICGMIRWNFPDHTVIQLHQWGQAVWTRGLLLDCSCALRQLAVNFTTAISSQLHRVIMHRSLEYVAVIKMVRARVTL